MRSWLVAMVACLAVGASLAAPFASAQGSAAAGGSETRPYIGQGSSSGDAALHKKVDAVFAAYDKPDSPGCSLGVIRDGELIYTRGYGRASLELGVPITSRTVFDIGSTSKQFTAASILLLEQQGKLSRDDDVRKWIPELPDYGTTITLRHLLHHTSGLRDYLTLMALAGIDFHNVTGDDDALGIIARQKALNFAPGDEHLYSNSGYFLLSIIVQRASGKNLREFAQENIFGPLAMRDTHYHNNHAEVTPRRAPAYDEKPGGSYQIDISNFEQLGDGAVFTTVEDLLLWDRNFYDPRVGGRALIDGLQTQGRLNSGKQLEYATGLAVSQYRGLPTVSHGGSWGGYRAELLRFPEQKFSVVCQCNLGSTNPSRLARQVAEVYLGGQMTPVEPRAVNNAPPNAPRKAPEPLPMPTSELEKLAGVYRNPQTGALRRVRQDGRLRMDSFGPNSSELLPLAGGSFAVAGSAFIITVKFEPAGAGFTVTRATEPPETERFERAEAFAPAAGELAAFAGSYFSEELEAKYVLSVQDGKLWMRIGYNRPGELQSAVRDVFVGPLGIRLEFHRDGQGRVTGLAVQAGRVRNISFLRQ